MKPRNILFITADQWRGDCLSALNHPVVRTSNLDALAREGTLFTRHFANALASMRAPKCIGPPMQRISRGII